ncbi:hypothetical protein HK102_006467 [Quaeritorhiza haematococci]|nr:hypothetical protein HK102_006467 [Quaeritorhiza haematococci]
MVNILNYIRDNEPDLYTKTRYRIIEISSQLAEKQRVQRGGKNTVRGHENVEIVNKSIFEWDEVVEDDCFFVALEVMDNFSHDLVRYDYYSEAPVQGVVLIDEDGDYQEVYEPLSDPLLREYLHLRTNHLNYKSPVLSRTRKLMRQARTFLLPWTPNLTEPEFIPTMSYRLLQILFKYFPKHRLVLSDFYKLPDTISDTAVNAPVVQTRYQGEMVPCSTYLVQPGWFDIFFPTDFELLRDVYRHMATPNKEPEGEDGTATVTTTTWTALLPGTDVQVLTQKQFLKKYSPHLDKTRTRSGENPMLSFYENVKFLVTTRESVGSSFFGRK